MIPAGSLAQSTTTTAPGSSVSVGGSAGASSNPLLGGTGSYGSAAQGSTTGGGAYTRPAASTQMVDEAFRRLDRNGDGTLTIEEFRAGYTTVPVGGRAKSGASGSASPAR